MANGPDALFRVEVLGDGSPVNWAFHRRHIAFFTPILDVLHGLSYVFPTAFAGRSQAEGKVVHQRFPS